MTISRGKVLLAIGMMSTALCGPGWAQAVAGMGGISGVVRDQSGATVPGGSATIRRARGAALRLTSASRPRTRRQRE